MQFGLCRDQASYKALTARIPLMIFESPRVKLLSGLLAIVLLVGCGKAVTGGGHVATINDETISKKEFEETMARTLKTMRLDPNELKGQESHPLSQMFNRITMQTLILTHLVKQEAAKRNLDVTQAEVDALYEKHIRMAGGEKVLQQQLQLNGLTQADFKAELREQILKDKLAKAVGGKKVEVSEAEVRQFYTAHAKEFDTPEQVRARHILISADPKQITEDLKALRKDAKPEELQKQVQTALEDKRKKAEELLASVQAKPNDFEALATKHSDDKGSAKNGGDLGFFAKEVMVPPFAEAAFSTKPGEICNKVVQSDFGYHIIQVVDRKAPQKKTFTDVKDQLTMYLENQRKSQVLETWLEDAKKSAKIVIEPEYNFENSAELMPDGAADAKKH